LVDQADAEAFRVVKLSADKLLLFQEVHRLIQPIPGLEDERLAAE